MEQNELQQLQSQLIVLKSRLFDASEATEAAKAQAQEYSQTLTRIVQILGIQPVDASVQLNDIVDCVEKLKATTYVAPITAEVTGSIDADRVAAD